MRCEQCREIVSAQLDGEADASAWAAASAHLRDCPDCEAYAAESEQLGRITRLRPVERVPDLTPRILQAAGLDQPAHDTTRALRIVLCAAALLQIALAAPALIL